MRKVTQSRKLHRRRTNNSASKPWMKTYAFGSRKWQIWLTNWSVTETWNGNTIRSWSRSKRKTKRYSRRSARWKNSWREMVQPRSNRNLWRSKKALNRSASSKLMPRRASKMKSSRSLKRRNASRCFRSRSLTLSWRPWQHSWKRRSSWTGSRLTSSMTWNGRSSTTSWSR